MAMLEVYPPQVIKMCSKTHQGGISKCELCWVARFLFEKIIKINKYRYYKIACTILTITKERTKHQARYN